MQCNSASPSILHLSLDNQSNKINSKTLFKETLTKSNDLISQDKYNSLSTKLKQNIGECSNKISEFIENNQKLINLDKPITSINSYQHYDSDQLNNNFNSLIKLKNNAPLLQHSMSLTNHLFKNGFDSCLERKNKKLVLTTSFDHTLESRYQTDKNLIKSITDLPSTSNALNYNKSLLSDANSINTSMIVNVSTPNLNNKKKTFSSLTLPSLSSPVPSTSMSACLSLKKQPFDKKLCEKICSKTSISNTVNFKDDVKDCESTLLKGYSNNIEQNNYSLDNSSYSNNHYDSGHNGINCKLNAVINRYTNNKHNNNKPLLNYSPKTNGYVECNGKNRHNFQQQPFDLEDVFLLQYPILPPNSHFFCCFYKFHITVSL